MIVVLDACVLYPPSLRDLLLTLAALDAFDVRWSDEILHEVTRNVLADHPDIDERRFVEHTIGAMRRAFPDAVVHVPAELVETLDNDPQDRHVGATALAADAEAIVTLNVADFESRVLRSAGVDILTPGALVGRLLGEFPDVVPLAVRHMADRWTNPPKTASEITELLAGHPTMAAPMAAFAEAPRRLTGLPPSSLSVATSRALVAEPPRSPASLAGFSRDRRWLHSRLGRGHSLSAGRLWWSGPASIR